MGDEPTQATQPDYVVLGDDLDRAAAVHGCQGKSQLACISRRLKSTTGLFYIGTIGHENPYIACGNHIVHGLCSHDCTSYGLWHK